MPNPSELQRLSLYRPAVHLSRLRRRCRQLQADNERLAGELARLDAEHHALVAILHERCPDLSPEALVKLVEERTKR